jgi:hypothetical protein
MLQRVTSATEANRGALYALCAKHNRTYASISKRYETISKQNMRPMLGDMFDAGRNRAVRAASADETKREYERYQFLANQQGLQLNGQEIKSFLEQYRRKRVEDALINLNANPVEAPHRAGQGANLIDDIVGSDVDEKEDRDSGSEEEGEGEGDDSSVASSSSAESSDASSSSSVSSGSDSDSKLSSGSREVLSNVDPMKRPIEPLQPLVYMDSIFKRSKSAIELACRLNSPYSGLITALQPPSDGQNVSADGFACYSKITTLLPRVVFNQKGDTRTDAQAKLHRALLQSSIPVIHSRDWELNKTKILEHYGLVDDIKPYSHIGWARRTGKTMSMAAYYAVFGLCMKLCLNRSARFGFISTGRPAVLEIFKYIYSFACQFADELGVNVRYSTSGPRPLIVFTLPGQADHEGVSFIGLPKGVDNNRGYQSFDGIIVDEAAYVQPEVYSRVVLPVLRLMGTTGVFLSSLNQDEENYFTQLAKIKNRKGDLAFNVVALEWTCAACKRKGEKTCPHLSYNIPAWFDNDRSFVLNQIGEIADPIGYRVELWGETTSKKRLCFSEADLERFEKAPPKHLLPPQSVSIFWDPGGGGGSLSAGVSFYIDRDGDLVVSCLLLFLLFFCLLVLSFCCSLQLFVCFVRRIQVQRHQSVFLVWCASGGSCWRRHDVFDCINVD